LKNDPDNNSCLNLVKKIRNQERILNQAKTNFENNNFQKSIDFYLKYLDFTQHETYALFQSYSNLCTSYKNLKDFDNGINWCSKLIENVNNFNEEDSPKALKTGLLNRAEIYLFKDDFEKAEIDANELKNKHQNSQEVHELLNKINRLKRIASRVDYYKVLGVEKTASKNQIRNAYKKLALKYHPDRFKIEKERTEAETNFRKVTAAYEVLFDEEKRKKYDDGNFKI
jgi:DnaJ-domain-containing protein 1